MAKNRTVAIGAAPFQAVCAIPRDGIGFWEAVALTVRGRLDASRNSDVPDQAHTHSLYRLMAVHRRRETEAVGRIDEAISAVDRAEAPLVAALAAPLVEASPIPTSAELEQIPDSERAQWASRVRAAAAAHSRAAQDAGRRQDAQVELAVLRSIRRALAVEGDDVRHQWHEAYRMRAARYTRARFGRNGRAVSEQPAVAGYSHAADPTVDRDGS